MLSLRAGATGGAVSECHAHTTTQLRNLSTGSPRAHTRGPTSPHLIERAMSTGSWLTSAMCLRSQRGSNMPTSLPSTSTRPVVCVCACAWWGALVVAV
jgi:hypothetical protein